MELDNIIFFKYLKSDKKIKLRYIAKSNEFSLYDIGVYLNFG